MRIGEVAEVATKTLRYYETAGLVPEPDRTPAGYRDYPSPSSTASGSSAHPRPPGSA